MTTLEDVQLRLHGRYDIERELGRGGMGAVYLARDVKLGRLVALKVLPAEFATQVSLRERFLRETRMAASFSHPNIVPVYAVEETDDLLAYVMGYVEGESLAERVRRAGPLGVRDTVRLLQDVGYALAYAHGRAIVHRDIKPDNVMIERATGRALVMDFGVSRVIAALGPATEEGLTRVGEVVGTAEYMSPEQATGDRVDGRSDLYSLGLTAYFAVMGTVAMAAESTGKALAKQITLTLPPMISVRPDLPQPLADAIDRCLAKEPDARFPNAEALVEALDAAQLSTPEIPVPIRGFAHEAASLSFVLIGGAVLVYFMIHSIGPNDGRIDGILPVLLLAGILMSRVAQSLAEARHLAVSGFSAESVNRGLVAVMGERESRRSELRASPRARGARRRTLMLSAVALVAAALTATWVRATRVQVGPQAYAVRPGGAVMIVVAFLVFGAGAVMIVRSPFRMPLGERLFRFVWLGPVGRGFVRVAGRGLGRTGPAASAGAGVMAAAPVVRTAVVASPASAPNHGLDALELRVRELERWRQER